MRREIADNGDKLVELCIEIVSLLTKMKEDGQLSDEEFYKHTYRKYEFLDMFKKRENVNLMFRPLTHVSTFGK